MGTLSPLTPLKDTKTKYKQKHGNAFREQVAMFRGCTSIGVGVWLAEKPHPPGSVFRPPLRMRDYRAHDPKNVAEQASNKRRKDEVVPWPNYCVIHTVIPSPSLIDSIIHPPVRVTIIYVIAGRGIARYHLISRPGVDWKCRYSATFQ